MTVTGLRPARAVSRAVPRAVRLAEPREQYLVLFLVVFCVYALTASYRQQSIDTASAYFPAWQLAHHGNLTMDRFAAPNLHLWLLQAKGRLVSNRFPGVIFLSVPLYLLDSAATPLPYYANITAAAVTAGAVVAAFALFCRLCPSRRQALAATAILAFATPTWTVSGNALWTHGPGQFWLLLGLLGIVRGRFWAAGLAFGLAVLTRPHYAVVAAVLAAGQLLTARRLRPVIALSVGTGLGVLALLAYNRHVYGTLSLGGGYRYASHGLAVPTRVQRFPEGVLGTLISPSRGVLLLTPFLWLLLPGLPAAWRAAPGWVRSAAVAGGAYMVTQLHINGFSGGYSFFSYRLAIEWLTLSAPLLVLSYRCWTERRSWRRRLFAALVAYSVATSAAGVLLFRDETVEPDYWRAWNPGRVWLAHPVAASGIAALALVAFAGAQRLLRPRPLPAGPPAGAPGAGPRGPGAAEAAHG